ncbi:hypothetical protein F4825DRAFT_464849 [Nemania diffusa]|nr:hypothetical protein F4825DRAFT_464849 [Nemania diffusa]
MAASHFGVLSPLQHYNQQQPAQPQSQQQQQQQQQPQQQQRQQYNQLRFQQASQPPLSPPSPPPPTSQQQQQPPPQPQHPQSPTLNGDAADATASPLQPQQTQTRAPAPATTPAAAASTQISTDSTNPPHVTTAATASSPDNSAPPEPKRRRRTKKRRLEEEGDSLLSSPIPPRPPTVHPFSKGPYDTIEDAIFSLQLHVFNSGYGVSQKRTVKEKLPSGKYDPDGDVIRKDFACDKGGNEFVSQSRGERRRASKKCGCPWKAAIRRLRREGDRWFIEILEPQHNHPITAPDEMHTLASYRRWQRENNAGIRGAIARLARAAAMPTRDIAAYLKGDVRDPDLDRIDKQILRALSINDKEVPGSDREGGSVVFEMLARRPVIILQDNDRTYPSSTAMSGFPGVSNPPPVTNHPPNPPNPPPPTVPFREPSATYHHTFASTFTSRHNIVPIPVPGTAAMHPDYPAVPQ